MSTKNTIKEMKEVISRAVEFLLGSQLASDDNDLFAGKVNTKRLSKISELEAFCFPYLLSIPSYRGGNAASKVVYDKLDLNMSVGGWNKRLINDFVGATRGVPSIQLAKKPGLLARNTTKRGWKDKAEIEGKQVVE